jgi:hypothetical protein
MGLGQRAAGRHPRTAVIRFFFRLGQQELFTDYNLIIVTQLPTPPLKEYPVMLTALGSSFHIKLIQNNQIFHYLTITSKMLRTHLDP